jgi:hypothetical protein
MPAKPGKERSLLERFISVYENDSWANADCDWIDERQDGAVELIATRKSDRTTLAIEHTVIQPYGREKEDFARFDRAFTPGAADGSLDVPGAILYIDLPAGTLRPGDDWNTIADSVRECIRAKKQTLPEGYSRLQCPLTDGRTAELQVLRQSTPGDKGQTIIRRYGPFDLASTVRTALEKKLPKLLATKTNKHLLMLERDQWHVNHTAIRAELERFRGPFPLLASAEIWIAETHENRRIVLFDPVLPGRAYDPVFTFVGDVLLSRHDR